MADSPSGDAGGPADVYPLVDYPMVQRGEVAPTPSGNGHGPGNLSSDPAFVVIDHSADEVDDHYLNDEDMVAAGLLGPEHDPVIREMRAAGIPPRRRHRLRSTLLAMMVVIVGIVVAGFVYVRHEINPGGRAGPVLTVVVKPNSSTAMIGSLLAKAGVIHDGALFAYYVKLLGAGPLLSGTYHLAKDQSYGAVAAVLRAGPPKIFDRLTIPEGYTLADIALRVAALPGLQLSAAKFLAASTSGTVRSPYEPAGVNNLEGLVFPATYDIGTGDTEVDVMEKMVGAFNDNAAKIGLTADAAALHLSPYDVVKVASIIEREAKLDPDRGGVASTIYNRLDAHMTLGADSTLVYALRQANPQITIASINYNQPNPYNTRLNKGLPPTPIANPGLPSLEAAAKPPKTNDLYFVEISPNGRLGFASTNAGFAHLEDECKAVNLC